jgi:hypothetical protein
MSWHRQEICRSESSLCCFSSHTLSAGANQYGITFKAPGRKLTGIHSPALGLAAKPELDLGRRCSGSDDAESGTRNASAARKGKNTIATPPMTASILARTIARGHRRSRNLVRCLNLTLPSSVAAFWRASTSLEIWPKTGCLLGPAIC